VAAAAAAVVVVVMVVVVVVIVVVSMHITLRVAAAAAAVVVVVMVVVVVVIVVVSMHITVPRVGRSQPVSPQYMQMYSSIPAHTRPLVRLRWCAEYLHPQTTVLQLAS
jgi:hypothetical protein